MKTLIIISVTFFFSYSIYASDSDPSGNYKSYNVKSTLDETEYSGKVFKPLNTSTKFILLIPPNIAGLTSLEYTMGSYFASNGYLVLMTNEFKSELSSQSPDTQKADSDFLKLATGPLHLLSIVEKTFDLPKDLPVFLLGASQGAIASIMIASEFPRARAMWFTVGGGDLPKIYSTSLVPQVVQFRINHKRVLGIKGNSDYEAYLRANLKNDPGIACKNISMPFHQTIALYDDMVPTQTQEYLVDNCPPHQIKRVRTDHIFGANTLIGDREEIKDFFESSI